MKNSMEGYVLASAYVHEGRKHKEFRKRAHLRKEKKVVRKNDFSEGTRGGKRRYISFLKELWSVEFPTPKSALYNKTTSTKTDAILGQWGRGGGTRGAVGRNDVLAKEYQFY